MINLVTLTDDGEINAQTSLSSVAHELKSVWMHEFAAANTYCESVNTASRTHLSNSIRDATAYGTARSGEAHAHCRSMESSRISDGTNYVNQKKQWVNSKLATKEPKKR